MAARQASSLSGKGQLEIAHRHLVGAAQRSDRATQPAAERRGGVDAQQAHDAYEEVKTQRFRAP
jgi:hypothetical protein